MGQRAKVVSIPQGMRRAQWCNVNRIGGRLAAWDPTEVDPPPTRSGATTVSRRPLPHRRPSWTQKIKIPDVNGILQTFHVGFGEYPQDYPDQERRGRLGEVWIDDRREGSFTRGVLGTLARQTSMKLQSEGNYESNLREVISSLRDCNFPPNGMVIAEGSSVRECSSLPDYIAQEIERTYLQPSTTHPTELSLKGEGGNISSSAETVVGVVPERTLNLTNKDSGK